MSVTQDVLPVAKCQTIRDVITFLRFTRTGLRQSVSCSASFQRLTWQIKKFFGFNSKPLKCRKTLAECTECTVHGNQRCCGTVGISFGNITNLSLFSPGWMQIGLSPGGGSNAAEASSLSNYLTQLLQHLKAWP